MSDILRLQLAGFAPAQVARTAMPIQVQPITPSGDSLAAQLSGFTPIQVQRTFFGGLPTIPTPISVSPVAGPSGVA